LLVAGTLAAQPAATPAAEPAAAAGTEAIPPPASPATPAGDAPAPPEASQSKAPLAPTPLGRPLIDVHVDEPPPPEPRRVRVHDGFYLRSSVGLVTARTYVTSDQLAHPSYTVAGGGLALDLMVGGTPSTGLALGGALSLQSFGHGGGSTSGLGLLGVFVDGFPMPNRGLHVGGMLGLGASRTRRPGGVDELRGGGLGMAAWAGGDFWVADEWSMGGLLRLSGALTRDGSNGAGPAAFDLESSSYALAFLFSVLYH
jgi:hypothetical protein